MGKGLVYLAGPLGFSAASRLYHDTVLRPAVEQAGWAVFDPWENDLSLGVWAVASSNADAIDRCDGVLAVLDGTDVDSGTAAEIGYAAARSKRIVGLRLDSRLTGDSAEVVVNLQVEYFIRLHGGTIARSLEVAIDALGSAS